MVVEARATSARKQRSRGALDYTQFADEDGAITRDTYQHNDKGQLTQKTIVTDNNNKSFTYLYTYDSKGNLDEFTYPSDYTIKNEYKTGNGVILISVFGDIFSSEKNILKKFH